MKIAKCSVKSLLESLYEHDILNSDELSKLGSSTLVIFNGVCMYTYSKNWLNRPKYVTTLLLCCGHWMVLHNLTTSFYGNCID